MAFAQRTDPGIGGGSVLLNLAADTVWNPASQRCPRALYVEGAGAVSFVGMDGNTDTWNVQAYTVVPLAVQRVYGSSSSPATTATGVHAIF